ncbi:MAG: hypothetical protein JO115_03895 [Pseudonocardiales bacterium]|nr:hypothetical protein [Pseudonocardiales bacterium]
MSRSTVLRPAPQKTKVDPISREVLRVLISLHQRSNLQLVQLAKRAGLTGERGTR